MLSDYERKTLGLIQSDLTASDPDLVRSFMTGGPRPAPRSSRGAYLIWTITVTAALLNMLSLAIGIAPAAFLFGVVTLTALACQLWWPGSCLGKLRRRTP